MSTNRSKNILPALASLPALILGAVVFTLPMLFLFAASVHAPHFSLVNYREFFHERANIRVLLQTIEIATIATGISIVFGYPVAYLITQASRGAKIALICAVVIPYLTSLLVRTYAWVIILGDNGFLNSLLIKCGLIDSPLSLIYTRTAVYIGMVHILLPVMILPLLPVMAKIDKQLLRAAGSMGASPLSVFWRIFFPLSLPGLRSGAILVFILSLGFYITPAALGGLRDAMLSNFIASQAETSLDLGAVATPAIVLLAVAIAVLCLFGAGGTHSTSAKAARKSRNYLSVILRKIIVWCTEAMTPLRARAWKKRLSLRGRGPSLGKYALYAVNFATLFFLLFPSVVVVVMSFSGGAYLEFPPHKWSLQWYQSYLSDPGWTSATVTSLEVGIGVVLCATSFGTAAAYGLYKTSPTLRTALTFVLLSPIILPVIIVAVGAYLSITKMKLIGSELGVILAHSIGATALVLTIVSAALAQFDERLEQAALSMGASPVTTFRKITLPIIRPAVIAGALFAFIHSFDEVVITSFVSGMTLRTLPLKMWENMRHQIDPTIAAVASLLVLLPIVWFAGLYMSWRVSERRNILISEAT